MKIRVGHRTIEGRAISYDPSKKALMILDQRLLPEEVRFIECKTVDDVAGAIKDMAVRGAPAIGIAAVYGIALGIMNGMDAERASEILQATRPTAKDLFHAIDYMLENLPTYDYRVDGAIELAAKYMEDIINRCSKIGVYGAEIIKDGYNILTHCNAGALATVDYGTALAPMRIAWRQGKRFFVYVDETRPRLQGAKLTAWELMCEGIPHAIIVDNAAGYYMWKQDIDLVITGADRVTRNGDAANKIGTYEKAVVARENGIPFYIAIPMSTYDPTALSGNEIPIEERNEDEVLYIDGKRIAPMNSNAKNPAFDIIPAKYISGYITEYGIVSPHEISSLYSKYYDS